MKRFNETYRQRKFITRNQWADTYKATHADTEEQVTLKVLVKQHNDEKYINNLLKEVEKIKNIRNINLIHVNNMFQYSAFGKTYPYIEGEYFKGISLKEKISTTKFDKDEAIKIVVELASVIREFHKENMLFNNLNLDNIYMNKKNIVKIDVLPYLENKKFTIVSQENSEEGTTENIEEIFTPQKDIYDLGVILYSLLSGNSTFEVNKLSKYIYDKNLLYVIEKATNDKLESKYHTVNRFIADLKSYLSCGELSSNDDNYEEEKVVKPKRKKGKFKKTLGICATLIVVVGGSVYGYDYLQKNNIKSNKNEVLNEKTNEEKDEEIKKEIKKDKEVKEDKVDESKNTTSNNVNNNESTNNNYSDNSSNNTVNKPNVDTNKPNNNENSGSTNTTPDGGGSNDKVEETPEVTPTPNPNPTPNPMPTPDNSGDNVTPEVPQN